MSDPSTDMYDQFDALLDRERTALLEGDLDQLARMFPDKEQLIEALSPPAPVDQRWLERIHRKLMRNQGLLNGAATGIRSVADRMTELRLIREGISTYDAGGRRNQVAVRTQSKLEKRA